MKKKCVCSIGGQAVLDGVMMRGKESMAIAVRAQDGSIMVESERLTLSEKKKKIAKIPIIRGIVNFADSLLVGMKTTTRSTEVFDTGDEEPSKFEKWLSKTFKVDIMDVVTVVGVILGVILSVGLFVVLPLLVAQGIFALASLPIPSGKLLFFSGGESQYTAGQIFGYNVLYNLILGVVRMGIFIAYIALISKMKDIRRLFMYHGAEHKTISCYEHGLELTPQNAQQFTTQHDRCGTTFLFIVMVISILFFTLLPIDLLISVDNRILQVVIRLVLRIILIPLVAGVSYEFLKLFAKYDTKFARAMKKPGLLLQKLTTKEPEDDMLEVAITAFNEVLLLEADPTHPTRHFDLSQTCDKVVAKIEKEGIDKEESELIVMEVAGAKTRTELYDGRKLSKEQVTRCENFAKKRKTGEPLQYVLGSTCFYGYDFVCDKRVLIPRADSEFLAEEAITLIQGIKNARVLDVCTGSGILAICIKKQVPDADVYACDISQDALTVAKVNAERLHVSVHFEKGNLMEPFAGQKFDFIVSNPPYIPRGEIEGLDVSVKNYEPHLALDGGEDGLDFYRAFAEKAEDFLAENGYILFEVGIGQAEKVADLFEGYDRFFVSDFHTPPVQRVVILHKRTEKDSKNV